MKFFNASKRTPFGLESGASAVEFALVLPFLLIVFFAIFEMSWLVSSQTILNHAVFEAGRTAAIAKEEGYSDTDATSYAKARAVNSYWMGALDPDDVTVNFDESGYVPQVEISALMNYVPLTGWFDASQLPGQITSQAAMPYH